jgi:hypothetical protein
MARKNFRVCTVSLDSETDDVLRNEAYAEKRSFSDTFRKYLRMGLWASAEAREESHSHKVESESTRHLPKD